MRITTTTHAVERAVERATGITNMEDIVVSAKFYYTIQTAGSYNNSITIVTANGTGLVLVPHYNKVEGHYAILTVYSQEIVLRDIRRGSTLYKTADMNQTILNKLG